MRNYIAKLEQQQGKLAKGSVKKLKSHSKLNSTKTVFQERSVIYSTTTLKNLYWSTTHPYFGGCWRRKKKEDIKYLLRVRLPNLISVISQLNM